MSTALVLPNTFGPLSTKFAVVDMDKNLSAGISSGFPVIGYRGKVWSIKSGGTEQQLLTEDKMGPRPYIDVVLVKASPFISKVYYEKGYTPGEDAAPDCFSNNGVAPDPSVESPPSPSCASCPFNAWGSRKNSETGMSKGKACADAKRIAVIPANALKNKDDAIGPLLLRIPPASLQDLKGFADQLQGWGYPYSSVVARLSFDMKESYPKFVFGAVRPLDDEEAEAVLALQTDSRVEDILVSQEVVAPREPAKPNFIEPQGEVSKGSAGGETDELAKLKQELAAREKAQADAKAANDAKILADAAKALKAKAAAEKKAKDDAAKAAAETAKAAEPEDELTIMRRRLAEMEAAQNKKATVAAVVAETKPPAEPELPLTDTPPLSPKNIEDKLDALMSMM